MHVQDVKSQGDILPVNLWGHINVKLFHAKSCTSGTQHHLTRVHPQDPASRVRSLEERLATCPSAGCDKVLNCSALLRGRQPGTYQKQALKHLGSANCKSCGARGPGRGHSQQLHGERFKASGSGCLQEEFPKNHELISTANSCLAVLDIT